MNGSQRTGRDQRNPDQHRRDDETERVEAKFRNQVSDSSHVQILGTGLNPQLDVM